jgi:hypothetical protein
VADLDNLARDILERFERLCSAGNRGTVASYRVYEAHGDRAGVRALVIGDDVLHAFETDRGRQAPVARKRATRDR